MLEEMNGYKEMITRARKSGIANEQSMWRSIDDVDDMLELLKENHPDEYWGFMRKTHANIYGCHYDEEFARYDIEQMHHTDSNGKKHNGAHWAKDEVVTAWQGKVFPQGTTDCDKWVAANAMWHDLNVLYDDKDVMNIAYLFYFADEDAPSGKVWKYTNAMHG